MPNYNPYYPNNGYQQYPYQQYPYQQQFTQGMQPQQNTGQQIQQPQIQPQVQPQIQNGGFISVRGKEEALNYPVAPGTSVTFKDENAPYVYTKTKGFSQLEQPVFEIYRLVKEEERREQEQSQDGLPTEKSESKDSYALKSDLLDVISDFNDLRKEVDRLKKQLKNAQKQEKKENPTVSKMEQVEEESEVVEA